MTLSALLIFTSLVDMRGFAAEVTTLCEGSDTRYFVVILQGHNVMQISEAFCHHEHVQRRDEREEA
jgi:hypothetical protein